MSNTDEIRWRQRLENFGKALAQLGAACDKADYSDLERAGLVQMFEFSFELAWKVLKDLLFYEGHNVKSPREVARKSFEMEYISEDDSEVFLDAISKRNLLCHTYEEEIARQAENLIKNQYYPLLQRICDTLETKRDSS
ncbi:MAG: nucleotidyltransferase substrate binding protein [Phycisphaerae bacterium]|nr:nucleotidyltransferase substrate binding protein [Planctomycetota bacterium]MBL7219876.1 nucleotidyltransferase substrate binding protein [Phycisphaerae bacterium]